MEIYADNAATTKICPAALSEMTRVSAEVYGNPSSPHTAGQNAARTLWDARERVARLIGASPREITFTSCGTEADNQAILSAVNADKTKKHIVSTRIEHHAVLRPLEALARNGYEITPVGVGRDGTVDPADVARAIRPDTALVSVMFANNEIGTVQNIAEIGERCREAGVLFHTDAVQAVGHLPIDVGAMNVDFLTASAHKFHGPRGAGFLYARSGTALSSLLLGGGQERGRRAGTENLPAIAGMAAALEQSCAHMTENAERMTALRDRIIDGILSSVPHSILNGARDCRLPNNVSVAVEDAGAEAMILLLDGMGIAVSSGAACAAGAGEPSHVLQSVGLPPELVRCVLRITPGEELTEPQADRIIASVAAAAARLRELSPGWNAKIRGEQPFIIQ